MRTRLLQLLRCPICVVPLDLEIFAYNGDEIVEGVLRCQKCGAGYPIIERIPRMLPDDLAGEMRALNRDFFARHPGLLPRAGATARGTFDSIYSIGVLHHLPDPERAFCALAPYVKPDGTLFAWIYGPRHGVSEAVTRVLRRVTTRMDYRLLYALCAAIAGGLRFFSHYPYRVLSRVPGLSGVAERLPLHDHHRYPFKVVVADAFDRLSVPLVRYYTDDDLPGWP